MVEKHMCIIIWISKWDCKNDSARYISIEMKNRNNKKVFSIKRNVGCGQLPWIRIFIPISHGAWLHYASFNVRWRLQARTKWVIVQCCQCLRKFQEDFTSILLRANTFAARYTAWWPMRVFDESERKINTKNEFYLKKVYLDSLQNWIITYSIYSTPTIQLIQTECHYHCIIV